MKRVIQLVDAENNSILTECEIQNVSNENLKVVVESINDLLQFAGVLAPNLTLHLQ